MKVSLVSPMELRDSEMGAWRKMQAAQPHLDNPFLSPEFAIAVGHARKDAEVAVVSDGDDPIAFFPFERHRLRVGKPIGGWLSTCQGIVYAPGAELDARELLKRCGLDVWEFGCLVEGQRWFSAGERLHLDSVVMDLGRGYESYLAELRTRSAKLAKSLRYQERRLGREIGEVTFDFDVRDEEQLRLVRTWKSAQYRGKGRADRFAQPWVVDLVERLHQTRSDGFAGVLSMLYADGRPIAGHFGLRTGGAMISWFPAYDTDVAKYSPGLVQHLHMARAAADTGIRSIDLGPGVDWHYKQQLKSRTVTVSEGCVRRPTAAGAVHWTRRTPADRAKTFILRNERLYGLADRTLRRTARLRAR
ncbi:GNAT family N-acetyltransferase [Spirillospora sp. NPDC047279]|uniref:GNAT family N-acetyltransferase n=1 Tax=Spirillospora sp. NPDC047279 TaxID=3155478 RepID=UPI0033F42A94